MEWKTVPDDEPSHRVRHKFLWLPKTIDNTTRWLEWAAWREAKAVRKRYGLIGIAFKDVWVPTGWMEKSTVEPSPAVGHTKEMVVDKIIAEVDALTMKEGDIKTWGAPQESMPQDKGEVVAEVDVNPAAAPVPELPPEPPPPEPKWYKFKPIPCISAFEVACVLAEADLKVVEHRLDKLPGNVKRYFTPCEKDES